MLTAVAIVVVIILLTAVVPKITEQFVHMKQQLPLSTRILLGLSDTLQHTGPTLLATVFIVAVGFWLWLKRGNNRHRFHAMLLRVALIGPLICAINSARYLRTLSIFAIQRRPSAGWDEFVHRKSQQPRNPQASGKCGRKRSAG